MKKIRVAYRLFLVAIHVAVGLAITGTVLRHGEGRTPRNSERTIISWWMRRLTHILGLNIKVFGIPSRQSVLVVSNHISWLDVPVLSSLLSVSFVSKIEIRHWPLAGVLSARSGTLFIQRGGKNVSSQAAEQIAFRLRGGDSIAIFPEGKTSDGHSVRHFHPRLFGAAVHAEVDILPVAIRYPHAQGVHPAAPFQNDEPFFWHGVRVLSERQIDVEVTLCRRLASQSVDRDTLAKQAHEAVRQVVECRPELAQAESHA